LAEILTTTAAREHLRVGASITDVMLAPLILAAIGRIEGFLGRSLIGDDGWTDAEAVPPLVVHAVKLALSDFWINREAPELTDDQLRPIIGRHMVLSLG